MSRINSSTQYVNVVPQVQPVDAQATARTGQWISLKQAHKISFLAMFGVITSTSADQSATLYVEATTAADSTSAVYVPFTYRKSGAVAANTWGAVTAATSAGLAVTTDDDGFNYWIEVDPSALVANTEDAYQVRLIMAPDAGATVALYSAIAFVEPRYSQATMNSTTA